MHDRKRQSGGNNQNLTSPIPASLSRFPLFLCRFILSLDCYFVLIIVKRGSIWSWLSAKMTLMLSSTHWHRSTCALFPCLPSVSHAHSHDLVAKRCVGIWCMLLDLSMIDSEEAHSSYSLLSEPLYYTSHMATNIEGLLKNPHISQHLHTLISQHTSFNDM